MAIKAFNSIAGFSVGNVPANIILGNGDITAANANFSGNGNIVGNLYTGNADLGNLAIANYFQGIFANGTTDIAIPDVDGNINLSSGGNANILVITPTGAYIQGTFDVTGNANVGNVLITPDSVTIGNTVLDANGLTSDNANIIGNLSAANANFDNLTANFANITANLYVVDTANIGNVRTDNLLYANGEPWDLQQPAGSNTWIQYNDGNSNFGASANLTYDDDIQLLTVIGNIDALNSTIQGNSNVGIDLNVTGNLSVGGNIGGTFATLNNDLLAQGNVTGLYLFAAVDANVGSNLIVGGVIDSNLGFNTTTGNANIGGNTSTNNLTVLNFANIANANIIGNLDANNINASNNINATGNVSGTYILGNGYYLTDINTSIISNGNSNVRIFENSNIALSVAGNANVLIISGTGINVTSTINSGDITANGNISANAIAVTDANVSNATVSGSVITAQITAPVGNITITAATGNNSIFLQPTGNGTVDANLARITSVATPNNATDAVNKQYVDDIVQGLNIHDSCLVATPNTLANITGGVVSYNNGIDGVGANLTTTTSYTLIDNVSVANVGTRILVKNEADAAWNGIYVYSSSNVITRANDYNTVPEIEAGDYTFVSSGDTYDNTGWVQVNNITTIGTDPIEFTQFSGAGTYTAGPGIALDGVQFSANTDDVTTAIVGSNIVVKANAEFTTPNIGAATGTSLIITGNLSGNNLSISNIANIGLDLNVFGNIQGNNISSNGNLSGNNLSAVNNVSAGSTVIGNNITANSNITANLGLYGNTLDLNLSANILGNIYLGANKLNQIVNPADTTLEVRGGWNNTSGILNLVTGDYGNSVNWAKIGLVGNSSGNAIIDNQANISYWKAPGSASNIVTINTLSPTSGSFNTGALVVTGGVGISGALNANGNVVLGNLLANVISTSFNSGALITYGGAGIGGNLNTLGNISTAGNIVAQGNATVSTSVTLGNTSVAWANVTTTSTAANQPLANLQITGSTITGIEFLVKGVESAGAKYSVSSVLIVTDGSNVNWTTYGTVRIGGSTGDLAAGTILSGGNNFVQLWVTPSSANSTQWVTQFRTI